MNVGFRHELLESLHLLPEFLLLRPKHLCELELFLERCAIVLIRLVTREHLCRGSRGLRGTCQPRFQQQLLLSRQRRVRSVALKVPSWRQVIMVWSRDVEVLLLHL